MGFIGASNVLTGRLMQREGASIAIQGVGWQARLEHRDAQNWPNGAEVNLAFRPEHVTLTPPQASSSNIPHEVTLTGEWHALEYAGTHWLAQIVIGGAFCTARLSGDEKQKLCAPQANAPSGKAAMMKIAARHIQLFRSP
jgi:ABC-type Fe3+/spermidine/putrescine transport system ATPase subunit